MNASHQNFISDTSNAARKLLDMIGELSQLDVLWSGTPNYDGLITQGEIDTVPGFTGAGLTTTHLADAEFALATIKGTLNGALPALTVLARLP